MRLPIYLFTAIVLAASPASFADQPNMEAALATLHQAKESLQKATPDKGGHRVNAIKLVEQAITEVKAGIEYDRTHVSQHE